MTTASQRVKRAEAKLEAAKLRVCAADMITNANAHYRQSTHPAYDGQGEICCDKGAQIMTRALRLQAEADLIVARAGSEADNA